MAKNPAISDQRPALVIVDCPDSQTVFVGAGAVSAQADWTPPTAIDSYSNMTVAANLIDGLVPGSNFALEPDNVHTITYGAEDAEGNVALNCEFSIIVQGEGHASC